MRPPPPAAADVADRLAVFVEAGQVRFGWSEAEADYVRGALGIARAMGWRAGVVSRGRP